MIPRNGLVAEYLFNGNADDSSGHGHHGAAFGATLTSNRFNTANSAYRFDGADDWVIIAPPPAMSAEALSVSVWVRYDPQSFKNEWSNCIVCQDNGNDSDPSRRIFQLSTNRNHIVWHRMLDARDPMFKQRLQAGIWYHVAAICEHGEQRLYVDGRHRDSVNHRLSAHAEEPIYIGRKGSPEPYFFFCGAIDDLRIYNRALSPGDVLALYQEGGFDKPVRPMFRASEDPVSGKWGQREVVFLDLRFDGMKAVSGSIMAGKPSNMAPVAQGAFDRATGALRLAGEATHPDNGSLVRYVIEGILDGPEVTVSAEFFGIHAGNYTLTKAGARRRWWPHSRVRRLLLPVAHRALRFVFGLARPSKATNSRLLRQRGEDLASLVIRDAGAADIPELAQLHVTTWNATYNPLGFRGPTVEVRERQWREKFAKADGSWFCMVIENPQGRLVGFVQGQRREDGPGDLNKIYLLSEYQRLGLGRRLMGRAARRFLALGITAMSLYVDPRNPSCGFYERLGGACAREPDGAVNPSWYVWRDLKALADLCPDE